MTPVHVDETETTLALPAPHARVERWRARFEQSAAGEVAARLTAIDFIDRAMLLAGIMVVWLIPALMVLDSVRGRSIVETVSRRMGLDREAAHAMAGLFRDTGRGGALTLSAIVVVVFGLLGAAQAVQKIYELLFEQDAPGARAIWRRAVWAAVTIASTSGLALLVEHLNAWPGGRMWSAVASFLLIAAYFWWTMHFLLCGRVVWRELQAPAVATALCWIGLGVFSSFYFSTAVIENVRQYGPIGAVFVLMTWLLAAGVVLILGPVLGTAWSHARQRRQAT